MVRMENIRKRFNGRDVLDGVNMLVRKGEAVALIGSSGSGKTTLTRIINGFVVPDSGKVSVGGKGINFKNKEPLRQMRKKMGIIYQLFNLVERTSAIENIDPNPVEAVGATGARFIQKTRHAVVPQVMPLFNSYNLYIVDRNIRTATIMGVVGAGGIGFDLVMSMKLFEHQKTATLILIILFTIMLVDGLSSYLRKKVV